MRLELWEALEYERASHAQRRPALGLILAWLIRQDSRGEQYPLEGSRRRLEWQDKSPDAWLTPEAWERSMHPECPARVK